MAAFEGAQAHESKLYSELAHVYDLVFTRIFAPRIHRVIGSLAIPPGARVLEVGVGTGLSLDAYPPHAQVVGVDLAPDMLEKAEEKVRRNGWRHIDLYEMDALDLKFDDNSFDYVMAFHVVSVVPEPKKLMAEIARVGKPSATIVIVNHFRSRNRFFAALDRLVEPITLHLGWHTLELQEVLEAQPLQDVRVFKLSRYSLFTILIARNGKKDAVGLSGLSPDVSAPLSWGTAEGSSHAG